MSFIRRLFGRTGDDAQRPNAAPDDGPDEREPRRERPVEAAPAMPPEKGDHIYLEFVAGSASKFYAVVLDGGDSAAWRVAFNYGRIGFPRAWAAKVEGVSEAKARAAMRDLVDEKRRKGYERRPWPASLALPDGSTVEAADEAGDPVRRIYAAPSRGRLPEGRTSVGGFELPDGMLLAPEDEGGPRGSAPVCWVSTQPVRNVVVAWNDLAGRFPETGLWPLIVDPHHGIDRLGEVFMDIPRTPGAEPFGVLRRAWHENAGEDEDPSEAVAPFKRAFPGLARRTPGPRPASVAHLVRDMEGHLGLVAVEHPAQVLDTVGWMGPANYDLNPAEQSAVLDSWQDRFDAYLVGLGFDTLTLAVGRPPTDYGAALGIAAEHLAFCPDNIWQGVGTLGEYAQGLVNTTRWDFWWD